MKDKDIQLVRNDNKTVNDHQTQGVTLQNEEDIF
jgi:hypothetical protein